MRKAVVVALLTGLAGFGGAALAGTAQAATVHHPAPDHGKTTAGHGKGRTVKIVKAHHKHLGKMAKVGKVAKPGKKVTVKKG
jgi:hypothetical protein